MSTVTFTTDDFRAMTRRDGLTLVEFWGAWCQPCVAFLPVFEEASEHYPDVTFATVDTQAEVTLAADLGISGVPVVRGYRDGLQVMDHAGPMSPDMIRSVVDQMREIDGEELVRRAVAREPLPAIKPQATP